MAKTKISELEKMYGVDRKVLIGFLNENGIEAKTANSSVEDDAVKLVASRFGAQNKPAEKKAEPEKEAAAAPEAAKPAEKAAVKPVVKKRKIIIVTNNDVDRRGGTQRRPNRTEITQGRDNRGRMEAQKAYRPIKPTTVPSRMEVDYHKPEPVQPKPQPAPAPAPETVKTAPAEQAQTAAPEIAPK
ncbi:MAG: translation initiation factor IF-2 N-terminal domain-containing protein, partial [Lachnospiraceae bacterium]|nr:translation initiation factor IF-2 N-terminal domain-containing protein [Lachnospiraceae bacterium]